MLRKNIMILITAFLLLGCHDSEINKTTDNKMTDTNHEQPIMMNEEKDEDNDTENSVSNAQEKGILKFITSTSAKGMLLYWSITIIMRIIISCSILAIGLEVKWSHICNRKI